MTELNNNYSASNNAVEDVAKAYQYVITSINDLFDNRLDLFYTNLLVHKDREYNVGQVTGKYYSYDLMCNIIKNFEDVFWYEKKEK